MLLYVKIGLKLQILHNFVALCGQKCVCRGSMAREVICNRSLCCVKIGTVVVPWILLKVGLSWRLMSSSDLLETSWAADVEATLTWGLVSSSGSLEMSWAEDVEATFFCWCSHQYYFHLSCLHRGVNVRWNIHKNFFHLYHQFLASSFLTLKNIFLHTNGMCNKRNFMQCLQVLIITNTH